MNSDALSYPSVTLDAADLRLLALLQADASLSNQDLAAAAHVSAATCLRRVRRLVEAGIVERRVAILSPERLGAGLTVIAEVTLDRQGAEFLAAFERRAVDMPAWNATVGRLFTQDANVRNVKSYFSVRRAKFETRIALPGANGRPVTP